MISKIILIIFCFQIYYFIKRFVKMKKTYICRLPTYYWIFMCNKIDQTKKLKEKEFLTWKLITVIYSYFYALNYYLQSINTVFSNLRHLFNYSFKVGKKHLIIYRLFHKNNSIIFYYHWASLLHYNMNSSNIN